MKILVADDSRVMRQIVIRTLRQAGYEGVTWPSQYLQGAKQLHITVRRAQEDAARKLAGLKPPKPEIAGVRLGGNSADLGVFSASNARKA